MPHHLPGENPYLTEFAQRHGLPSEAARGGAETIPGLSDPATRSRCGDTTRRMDRRRDCRGSAVAGPMAADDPGSLEVLPAQGNVHVLAAAGGNTTVQVGSEGPLVDTQPAA